MQQTIEGVTIPPFLAAVENRQVSRSVARLPERSGYERRCAANRWSSQA